jgi:hypothetical protein
MQPFRLPPQMPATSYKTYQILAPAETHWRDGTCAEAECEAYLRGWQTAVDESNDLGQKQAHYIRKQSGRSFTETRMGGGRTDGATVFTFEAGQRCFRAPHRVPVGRPEIFVVRDGDWRWGANARRHSSAQNWVDEFGEHQERLADRLAQG